MRGKGCGIICEYNPFHSGHKYQLDLAKKHGDFTVCAMSGDFVQRGEPAFQEKEVRAENAVKNGADVVLEIPFPFSSFGAEGFAESGVKILDKSGLCESIMFGSECGDTKVLAEIAECVCKDEFLKKIVELRKEEKNMSFAVARQLATEQILGKAYGDVLKNPNDILGVEYIKAIKKTGSALKPIAVKRTTPRGGFDEHFASSGYIRECFYKEKTEEIYEKNFMPDSCCLEGIFENRDEFRKLMLYSFMTKSPTQLEECLEFSKGMGYAVTKSALKSKNFEEMCQSLVNKHTTLSKVRRMLLFGFFSVGKEVYKEDIKYTNILSLSEKGREAIKAFREDRKIIIASRVKDIKNENMAYRQYSRSRLASEVLRKCCSQKKNDC